jgi:hypothetical protein
MLVQLGIQELASTSSRISAGTEQGANDHGVEDDPGGDARREGLELVIRLSADIAGTGRTDGPRSAALPVGARSTYALDAIKEVIQRRRARLRPFRETVTARCVVVGSYLNRAGWPGLHELNIDASALQRPVGQDRRDCWSGWLFALAHHMPRPVSVAHRGRERAVGSGSIGSRSMFIGSVASR